ncbi:MAG: OB-fold nucleic acid binding domain-containing protein, partial [Chloroflexota bacterium]|nr:OB-fold nucleic acid binding domain-containing protein [Chloroflexota bacterium]
GQARLSWDLVRDHRHGLYLLCGGRRSRIWQAVARRDAHMLKLLARLQSLAERPEYFLVECQQYADDTVADGETLRQLLELAERSGARCIATQDVYVLPQEDGRTHRLLRAIGQQTTFAADSPDLPAWLRGQPSRYALPDAKTWHQRWDGLAHLVAGSTVVLRDCQVELLGKRRFPGATLPVTQVYDLLLSRAFAGMRQRYDVLTRELTERLIHEVNEVTTQGVAPFLLHAAELVERAAQRGIRMVLQGSGTGSLLCFALGISPVDPATTPGFVFERFAGVHRGQGDLPDLDFGIPAGREAEVKAILVEMFGAARVTHLASVVTLRERGAVTQAAKAFGWDTEQIRRLRQKLAAGDPIDPYEAMILRVADAIGGQPHHVMRHSSGLIVAEEPIVDLYGVGVCNDGALLLANKDDVELLQLLKFDILSWYGSAIFDQAEVQIHTDVYPKPELWGIGGTDPRTAELLASGDTRAIPYLHSPAVMQLMTALGTRTQADIAIALGALRPGASTTRPRLLAALHGGTATLPDWHVLTPDHQQVIARVLAGSHGAFLFDEDLLLVAHALGLTLADAERLRKALKKGGEQATRMGNQLRAAALEGGWNDAEIDVVQGWLHYIQRYTFVRGHALALANIAWRVAYLAAHYPVHFHAAVLDRLGEEGGGMYPQLVYAAEVRRHGITLVGPAVNSPMLSLPQGQTIRCGLRVLRCALSMATLERIHAEAHVRPFTSVTDLRARVKLSASEVEKLISAGALDTLTPSRRAARWEAARAKREPRDQPRLIADEDAVPEVAIESEMVIERAAEEYRTLGWTLSLDHPLDLYADQLAHLAITPAECIGDHVGLPVAVAGIVVAYRRIRTEQGQPMVFASLCDARSVVELTLFAQATQQYGAILRGGGVVMVCGTVQRDDERGVGVIVHEVHSLEQC